jgi:hypothetical protein
MEGCMCIECDDIVYGNMAQDLQGTSIGGVLLIDFAL